MHGRETRPGCSLIFGYRTGVVNYLGIRGATLPSLSTPAAMTHIAMFHVCADVYILHLGGNDLGAGSAPDPVLVALDIQRLAINCLV